MGNRVHRVGFAGLGGRAGGAGRGFSALLDAALGLLAAGLILFLGPGRDRARLACFAAAAGPVLALRPARTAAHRAARLFRSTAPGGPAPSAADEPGRAPFRVTGYDPLRLHDTDFDDRHKFEFLMPNLATLYRLEDINGFDP